VELVLQRRAIAFARHLLLLSALASERRPKVYVAAQAAGRQPGKSAHRHRNYATQGLARPATRHRDDYCQLIGEIAVKPAGQNPKSRRPYVYKAQDRIATPLLRLLRISPLRLSRSLRARRKTRSRQNQLTIEVLRYRLEHPEAMVECAGQTSYSDAFRSYVLARYNEAYRELTPEQFARAAGIAVAMLNVWLAPAQNPELEKAEATLRAEKSSAPFDEDSAKHSAHFEKWLSATRDFLNATGGELGWRAGQISTVLSKVISVMIRALPKFLAYRHYDKIAELAPPATVLFSGYGAQGLKQCYQKNLSRGLAISTALHFIALSVYWGISGFNRPEPVVKTIRIMIYPDLDSKIEDEAGSSKTEKSRQPWANNGGATNASSLGLLNVSNILLPLRVLPADYATIPPGPNVPDNSATTEMPMVDVAGLQALANQGIPSSIPGTGTMPLLHFVPKPAKTPQIDLASVGGENGMVLPSSNGNNIFHPQAQLVGLGITGDFNPTLEASKAGYNGGSATGKSYSTGRAGALPYRNGTGDGADNHGPSANDHKAENGGFEKIPLKSSGEKDWKSRDLKKLFHELYEWMQENPYDFPPALKHYMRYKNGDVTARVKIATREDNYELFMLCNEASEDFGLLLVAAGDSTQAICLRDTGFRKQSFYLSKGIASRNESAAVGSVSMLEERPTLPETSKFYNIFLSWWDMTNKAGGQKRL
jgi:hypothetical protein